MSVSQLVANRVSRMRRGTPFPIEGFYSLGSITSVQKALSRLAKAGKVARVAKGIYSRPKPLVSIPTVKVSANAEDVAKTWAGSRHYKLAPQGLESAYRLGLQTQAPLKTIYWTTGPSREFRVGNQLVQVKHTADSKLLWLNKPEGELYRGLLSLPAEHISISGIQVALKRLNLDPAESIRILNKLALQPKLSAWRYKLLKLVKMLHS